MERSARIEAQPRLFLRVDAATQPDAKSDTEQLIGDLHAISGARAHDADCWTAA